MQCGPQKILRHRTDLRTGKVTRHTVYVISDLTAGQASPRQIGHTARAQWVIENRVHLVRDTAFAEDGSKIRTGHGPENMATLRNSAINTLRAAGHRSIAAGLREVFRALHAPTKSCRPACRSLWTVSRTMSRLSLRRNGVGAGRLRVPFRRTCPRGRSSSTRPS